MASTALIDEVLKHFETDHMESTQIKQGIMTQQIVKILNIDISKNSHIEQLSKEILSMIQDIVKNNDSYKNCDDSTPSFIIKLFEYYHQIIMDIPRKLSNDNNNEESKCDKEQQSKCNKIRWKLLMVITESLISYFYKHHILNEEVIWTDIIQNILLTQTNNNNNNKNDKNNISTKRKVLILLQLISGCGKQLICYKDESILLETATFFKQYIINYVPTTRYAKQESVNMKRISWILQLMNDKKCGESQKKTKKKKKKKREREESEDEQILTSQIEQYCAECKLSQKEQEKRGTLIDDIGRLWKKVLFEWYPSLKLKENYKSFDKHSYITIYGSVATDLDEKYDSNIDIYLSIPSHLTLEQMDENAILKQLSAELNNSDNYNSDHSLKLSSSDISDCTAPSILIRCTAAEAEDTGNTVTGNDVINDININISYDEYKDKLKIANLINLLCNYNDGRIRELILSIKHWSKRRNINSSSVKFINVKDKSHLNSFGFILLIFKYLQIQKISGILTKTRSRNGYRIHLEVDNNEVSAKRKGKSSKKNKNKKRVLLLSKLLGGFFELYSEFDYDKYAISLFDVGIVEKKGGGKKGSYRDLNQRELGKSKLVFVIEYPLQTNYNCSKDVTVENAMLMKLEFLRANIILKYFHGDFYDLCKPSVR